MDESAAASPSPDFRVLFEAMPGCHLVLAPDFNVVAASDAYLRSASAPRQILLAKSIFEVCPPVIEPEALRAFLLQVATTGAADTLPMRRSRLAEGAEERYWRISGSPLASVGGKLNYIFLRFEDVSELAALEQRKAEAEEAMRHSIDEAQRFTYLAAHDLQSPLNAILGCVRLLHEECEGKLSEQGEKFMGYVVDYTQRAQTLIQDLLTYSRLETRAQEFAPTDLNYAFSDALCFAAKRIEGHGAEVRSVPLPILSVDRGQITLLLANLIDNALKFNNAVCPEVSVEARLAGAEWIFSVRDNGIGIEPRFHDEIFEIFRRLHSAQAYPGSGIGLAICHRVVTRHGGRIWVESEEGKGSIFYFTLPAAS